MWDRFPGQAVSSGTSGVPLAAAVRAVYDSGAVDGISLNPVSPPGDSDDSFKSITFRIRSATHGPTTTYPLTASGSLSHISGQVGFSTNFSGNCVNQDLSNYFRIADNMALGYRPPAPAACSLPIPPNSFSRPEAVM